MKLSEDDQKKLSEAMNRKEVDQCMRDILSDFEKYGELEEDDLTYFRTRLKLGLKRKDLPEIVEVKKGYVKVEVDDLRVELQNNKIELTIID